MIKTNLFDATNIHNIVQKQGVFSILEYDHDVSVDLNDAMMAYFASKMNIKKRQVIASLKGGGVIVQAGAMQMMFGDINASTNIKSAGDFIKKMVGSQVTGETIVKPRYVGNGTLLLEPTYKYILLENLANWKGGMVIEDGMFLACEDIVEMKVTSRNTISSAVLGQEGLFNTTLSGMGVVALESPVPPEELICADIVDDVVKIDGNMAIAWSNSLKFTVERTTRTLTGSAASGEGFVNVYRGTGRILIAPVSK